MIVGLLGRLFAAYVIARTVYTAWRDRNWTADRIHRRMLAAMPEDVQGEFAQDLTRLVAEEMAQLYKAYQYVGRSWERYAAGIGITRAPGESDEDLQARVEAAWEAWTPTTPIREEPLWRTT